MRPNFASSPLVRLLDPQGVAAADLPGADVAERLSLWLGAFDAIRLHALHQSLQAPAMAQPTSGPTRPVGFQALEDEFQRVKATLASAIAQDMRDSLPGALGDASGPTGARPDADFAPFRQRCADLQYQMELQIGALRDHVRQALMALSPQLRQLAMLDATLDEMLSGRAHKLLARVPARLKARFDRLRRAHQHEDEAAAWRQPGGWLARFTLDMQAILLAELEVRLEPVAGLIEASKQRQPSTHEQAVF